MKDITWKRDADGDLVAESGHYTFLIKAERNSWFAQKVTGWWLTRDYNTYESQSYFFTTRRDAKEFAFDLELRARA